MKEFGRWFKEQKPIDEPSDARAEHIARLVDAGVIDEMNDGTFTANCCRCGERTELLVGPEEIDVNYEHYCGGSPRCCP